MNQTRKAKLMQFADELREKGFTHPIFDGVPEHDVPGVIADQIHRIAWGPLAKPKEVKGGPRKSDI